MKDTDTLSVVMVDEKIEVVACPLSLKELYFVSEATLPEFHIMEMQEKTSRKSLSIANGAFYPSIRMEFNLNTGYYDTEKNNYGNIVTLREQLNNNMNKYIGVCVSLPLFNGLSRMEAVRKEKLRLQQVQMKMRASACRFIKKSMTRIFLFRLHSRNVDWQRNNSVQIPLYGKKVKKNGRKA